MRILVGVYKVYDNLRVTIPREVSEKLDVKPGDLVVIYYDDEAGEMIIKKRG